MALERAKGAVLGTVITRTGAPASGADVKLMLSGADSHYVFKSVVADEQGRFLFSGVPPGSYNVVALSNAVRDWEFGSMEWSQTERSANTVEIGDSALSPITLEAFTLRYDSALCQLGETQ